MNPVHTLPPQFRLSFILFSPPCLQLPSELYPSGFLSKLHMHFLNLICATCPTHQNLLELINPVMWRNQPFWEWSEYVTSAEESPKPFSIHMKVMAFVTQKEHPVK